MARPIPPAAPVTMAERSGMAGVYSRPWLTRAMGVTERERLSPDAFRLPVEKIREGYYSDVYFNYAKATLELEGHQPRVLMQVFQRKESILGGVDEAIAILRQCAGPPPPGRLVGGRLGAARGARAARGRRRSGRGRR